ncbi:MAG: hypothetical protein A2010_14900 [Nitrospirae bacterium GWD2_57_9]|nr:MAG: hypothetical protein A2010_14900 [Nitrospirae bacterium GWD2_57_9]OGW48524.1 MAG: hypothetical protein A2078_02535 [Nitrospirae bacterium GWC2_57_9]
MKYFRGIGVLSLFLITACASSQQARQDPLREEVAVLQKQLLELQQVQNDTKTRLEESNATISALSVKLKSLEERPSLRAAAPMSAGLRTATPVPDAKTPVSKKKPKKKTKKKVRRQE